MRSTFALLADHLTGIFAPLREAVQEPQKFRTLFAQLGWHVDDVPPQYANLANSIFAALDLIPGLAADVGIEDVKPVFDAVSSIYNDLKTLPPPPGVGDAAEAVAVSLFEFLLAEHLERDAPQIFWLLSTLGVITSEYSAAPDDGSRPAFVRRKLDWGILPDLLRDPTKLASLVYGWGEDDFDFHAFAADLVELLDTAGVSAQLAKLGGSRERRAFIQDPTGKVMVPNVALETFFMDDFIDGEQVEFGIRMSPLIASATSKPGFVLEPIIPTTAHEQIEISDSLKLVLDGKANFDTAFGVIVRPGEKPTFEQPFTGGSTPLTGTARVALESTFAEPFLLLGSATGSHIQIGGLQAGVEFRGSSDGQNELRFELSLLAVELFITAGEGDGFLQKILADKNVTIPLAFGIRWSTVNGLSFSGSAGFQISLPGHLDLGPVSISDIVLGIIGKSRPSGAGVVALEVGAALRATLGAIEVVLDGVGAHLEVAFESGNAGPVSLDGGLKFPNGVGITIDGGSVKGGGFLFIDKAAGRYAGAVELAVFSIAVKAFGLIETKLPDGTPGFSFVIIIIAEFSPIQLGFGFTLLGVGGLLGVNRSVNAQGLSDAVRTGSLEHVLFPHDPVHDAPAIIHDLATIFPAAKDHFIFGPMAKLGWGTPTLIKADLGIVIEFPGPRIAVLGILRMLLPDPDEAIVALQMAVAGLLDFPAKKFSLEASLFDSTVAGYAVTGDMAFRLEFGNNAKFLLAVGGFNSGFSPPAPFPDLRRVSVDFGVNGNPSLVASGYFALTSNTAQIGASIQLHASGYGITVDGWLGFDVLFVFSPFSLDASISAGMRASFHGHGLGITLHGNLTGPTPWHLKGKVCVSILWWDACLPIDVTFGDRQPVALPEIDPWVGNPDAQVQGLKDAISDPRNWSGSSGPAELPVVSLAASSTADRTPIDPLGSATLRQKVAPFNRKLEKFGEFKPIGHDRFDLGPSGGQVGVRVPGVPDPVPVTELQVVQDDFAPGHFMRLSNAQKLSLPSYVPMDAGVSVAADRIALGSSDAKTIEYVTKFIDDQGVVHDGAKHQLTDAQLAGLLKRSAAALGGVRRTGTERFMLPDRPRKIRLGPPLFVVADTCTMVRNAAVTGAPISQTEALLALRAHVQTNPQDGDRLAVVPQYAEAA